MALHFRKETKNITDDRFPEDKIFYVQEKSFPVRELSVTYTLCSDDIKKGEKPELTPYVSRADELCFGDNDGFFGKNSGAFVRCEPYADGVKFSLSSENEELSEFGINLPFNFMGKRNGGGWQNQFLLNSPYVSDDRKIFYVYLTKPNGGNVLVAAKGAAGWKTDYSPYSCGHYFLNLKIFANFDRAFCVPRKDNGLEVVVLPVKDFCDATEKLSVYYDVPFLTYDKNGGKVGDTVRLTAFGDCRELETENREKKALRPFSETITLEQAGETKVYPVGAKGKGGEVTLYAYESLESLYKKSMDSVDLDVIETYTDGNLCEHQSWCSAMLRFLLKYGDTLSEEEKTEYESKILRLLRVVTEKDPKKAVHRRTIFDKPHEGLPAYNIFKSQRIQEEFFGIGILLDAYKYFQDPEYKEYAVKTTDSLLEHYQKEDGRLSTFMGGTDSDYTTVCAPMIPLADMANFLKEENDPHAKAYVAAADKMAEYLYRRGMHFPTEGVSSEYADRETEDGSISCTALNLLYYCAKIRRDEKYIAKAKEILDVHESWVIETPRCQMHASSLRWWETCWEGDADGPALCCGHAWTIWRAEADYWYAYLSGDDRYYEKSFNGFLTNLSKIREDGTSYAIYNADDVNGGGFTNRSETIDFHVAKKYASVPDCGLSRYVWARLFETFLKKNSD